MKVFHGVLKPLPLPPRHRFPAEKYTMLREQLLERGVLHHDDLRRAEPAPTTALAKVHEEEYLDAFFTGRLERRVLARIGLPWSEALVERATASVGATVEATWAALDEGIAGSLGGGTHHAHPNFGAGYCVLNDLAVAARTVLDAGRVERVLIFDVDVHQGDGSAAIFASESRVFTCSIHGASCFPARKQESDLDVPLPDGTDDETYLTTLDTTLEQALERARPELVIYQAGVDVLATDTLGSLSLTLEGVAERDRRVFAAARRAKIPIVFTLGGGYGKPIMTTIEAHLGTFRVARDLYL